MRLFLALDTSNLNLNLKKLKVNLNKGKNLEHKWTPDNFWHIPLFSLKDVGGESFLPLSSLIKSITSTHQSFELKLQGVWAYPSQDHARVLWLGVQNSKDLRELQGKLMEGIGSGHINDDGEKPYKPHLPIVRLRNYKEMSDLISPFKNSDFGKISISKIVVHEMTSGGAFPTYRKVTEYELAAPTSDSSETTAHP